MIPRYTPLEIAEIFSDELRLRRWLDIELLASEGWAEIGRVPKDVLPALRGAKINVERINQLEAEQGHDVAAFVAAVQETLGQEGRFIHLGLTSSDIVDTALATQLRDAAAVIDRDAEALEQALAKQAEKYRLTLMMGRTHGVHAEPLTLGVKLAHHYDEVRRSRARLQAATTEIAVGQISGAVGTHASVSPLVEEHVCEGLGLAVAPAATQVLARDRHASFVTAMAILCAVLERLATTIRLLQITEVDEAEEPFSERQKGSSAMPHKRNPILCERICGLARVLRGYAMTSLDDIALWHERDISHSSAERVILPDACAPPRTRYAWRRASSLGCASSRRTCAPTSTRSAALCTRNACSPCSSSRPAGHARRRIARCRRWPAVRATARAASVTLVETDPEIPAAIGEQHLAEAFDPQAFMRHIDDTYRRLGAVHVRQRNTGHGEQATRN